MLEGTVMDIYYKEVIGIIDEIRKTERESILKAARMVADQVKQDKLVYVFGPGGHSNLAAMEVVFRAGASAAVGGIAFDDRVVHLLHQILDKLRLEEVVPAGFPCREFHGHLARRRTLQRLVQAHHILRRDVPHEIDLGCLGRFSAALC